MASIRPSTWAILRPLLAEGRGWASVHMEDASDKISVEAVLVKSDFWPPVTSNTLKKQDEVFWAPTV